MAARGKTVIVTGAASGLGKAIATAFLAAGANVVINDINDQRIAAVEAEWSSSYAGRFITRNASVTDEDAVEELIAVAVARYGRLDVLVNNAGIMDDFSPAGAISKAKWDRVLDVNLNGPYLTTKASIAQFEKQEPAGGLIINIGSNAGVHTFHAGAAYTVSKAGLLALTKNTASYYGPKGIYCLALILGGIDGTNITDAFAEGLHSDMFQRIQAAQTPFQSGKTTVPVESIAKYCVFLSDSDIAPNSNGACIQFNRNWPEQ
jgi:NAD(P)-dependent dehydrogenase (short-subunit alcohol dehydrogenase family)